MRKACLATLVLAVGTLLAGAAWLALPPLVFGWLLLLAATILVGRRAERRAATQNARWWASVATSGKALAWLSVLQVVMGFLALPTLHRARAASNEQHAREAVRAVLAAERRFHSESGAYTTLACLQEPAGCGAGKLGPLLDPSLASGALRFGYRGVLHAGPPADDRPNRFRSFAYLALPAVSYGKASLSAPATGFISYCGDDTGRMCRANADTTLVVRQGRCPDPQWTPQRPDDVPLCADAQ